MSKVSLRSQIAAVENAIRGTVRLSREKEELQKSHLHSALESLRWLQDHESDVRAFVASRREERP